VHGLRTASPLTAFRFGRAIRRGQIFVEYQPIVSLTTGEPLAAEALLRWRHPRRGLIQPASFIPGVERSARGATRAVGH